MILDIFKQNALIVDNNADLWPLMGENCKKIGYWLKFDCDNNYQIKFFWTSGVFLNIF